MKNNKKPKCVINKHYVFSKAHEIGLLTDFELKLYFKGYIQGMKDIVEPLGFEVIIEN